MATDKRLAPNIDASDLVNFPNGRIKDNTGTGNGTPVNRLLYSDIHEFFAKIMRLAALPYNGLPESEGNTYQLVDALIALAGKNDLVYALSSFGGKVTIDTKLGILKLNECLICKAGFNLAAETQITGSDAPVLNLTIPSAFKTGDYLRLIKTNVGATLIRLADGVNLDTISGEYNYLKATTTADEYTGTTQAAATTPYTNQLAFARRVIGLDSGTFLASVSRNGLLSKEQWAIINGIAANPVKNVGNFSGLDAGGGSVGSTLAISGDITRAEIIAIEGASYPYGGSTTLLITVANAMANNNYFVRVMAESQGTINTDNNIWCPVVKPISTTTFQFSLQEGYAGTQSLKIHCEVVQIS